MKATFLGVYKEFLTEELTKFLSESGQQNFIKGESKRYETLKFKLGDTYDVYPLNDSIGLYDYFAEVDLGYGDVEIVYVNSCFFGVPKPKADTDSKYVPLCDLLNVYSGNKVLQTLGCIVDTYNSCEYRDSEEALDELIDIVNTAIETMNEEYNDQVEQLGIEDYSIIPIDVKLEKK